MAPLVFVVLPDASTLPIPLSVDETNHEGTTENSSSTVEAAGFVTALATRFGQLHADQFEKHFYLTYQGRLLKKQQLLKAYDTVHLHGRVLGGKGGFGALLRSFGKKRMKGTNKNMCRDLSGRRVRDVTSEKNLKDWAKRTVASTNSSKIQKQKAKVSRIQRLKDRLEGTDKKHLVNDPEWNRERHRIPNFIHDAVHAGVKAVATKIMGAAEPDQHEILEETVSKMRTRSAAANFVPVETVSCNSPATSSGYTAQKSSEFIGGSTQSKPLVVPASTRYNSMTKVAQRGDDADLKALGSWCGLDIDENDSDDE